uniref:Lysosomal dipeptide transporter MFSD1 n=1 Tax=Schistosoma japonicum TaxID=6182 RepID=Q5DEG1_SCHJA|nr:SJCHGC00668 protein [Schistosoma japonicum]
MEEQELPQLTGCGASWACDPRRRPHRYIVLFFICFLCFGSYFCYDNPSALQDVFLSSLEMTRIEFMNLYAFYSWPNVVLSFVGGFLIDRVFGISWGSIIFSMFVLVGQILFGIGAYFGSIPTMYFSRLIFGIGGESLAVAQNTYSTEWFPSNELNLVFGLQISMSRIGSTVNMVTMQPLNKAVGKHFGIHTNQQLGASLLIASVTCLFSTICAVIMLLFTKRAKRILAATEKVQSLEPEPTDSNSLIPPNNGGDQQLLMEKTEEPNTKISPMDIIHFPGAIWLICIICVAYYVTVFPFVSLGLVFFQRKFGLSVQEAGVVNSLVYIISAVASPVFGAAIDIVGYNLYWLFSGISITLACHLCFAFTSGEIPPIAIMIVLGLSYSILASSLWPMVAYVLPLHQRGTAYGLIQSIQNLGLGLISIFAGYLVDTKGYLFLEVFFIFCLSIAITATFGLLIWDHQYGIGLLNESGISRRSKSLIKKIDSTTISHASLEPVLA